MIRCGVVVRARGLWWRPGLDGSAEEERLECGKLALEHDDVQCCVLRCESLFGLLRDLRMFQDSSVRRLWVIVASRDFASVADFLLEFHDGKKEVAVQA